MTRKISGQQVTLISIHALLVESDATRTWIMIHPPPDFYPRSPCGERRTADMTD